MYLGNFTPGPWYLMVPESLKLEADGFTVIAETARHTIRGVYQSKVELDNETAYALDEANAHLIAAAPDLFREVVFAREMLLNMSENDPVFASDIGTRNFLSRLEEIISKVRGQKCLR